MGSFTPGPWTARWICNNDWNIDGPKPPSYGNENFIEADARLMAAAPELHAALVKIRDLAYREYPVSLGNQHAWASVAAWAVDALAKTGVKK
jgi:hypothetical protein